MFKAYFEIMHEIEFKDTLFEKVLDWKDVREGKNIENVIMNIWRKSLDFLEKTSGLK